MAEQLPSIEKDWVTENVQRTIAQCAPHVVFNAQTKLYLPTRTIVSGFVEIRSSQQTLHLFDLSINTVLNPPFVVEDIGEWNKGLASRLISHLHSNIERILTPPSAGNPPTLVFP